MFTEASALPLQDLVHQSKTAIVLLPENPSYDLVASGLSIFLALREAGKDVQIGCSTPMSVEFTHLVGVDEIKEKVGNRNLMVSFNYVDSSVDRVSYSLSEDNKLFHLIIAPKTGAKPLDFSDVKFEYTGAEADVVFVVGAKEMNDLAHVYQAEKQFFDSAYTVAFTQYPVSPFARMHFDAAGQTCLAEAIAHFLSGLGLEPKEDVATNLLSSVELSTNRFQSHAMNAETFELIGRLLRNGAQRSTTNPVFSTLQESSKPSKQSTSKSVEHAHVIQLEKNTSSIPAFAHALKNTQISAKPVESTQSTRASAQDQHPPLETAKHEIRQLKRKQIQQPPVEWLQPKVFTGSTKV